MGGSVPEASSSKSVPARSDEDSTDFSMRDLENEIVDISSSSSGPSATSPSKVKLLFAKSKGITSSFLISLNIVYVHPSPRAKDNIPGWFALVERQGGPSSSSIVTRKSTPPSETATDLDNILLAWIPESLLPPSQSEYYVKVELSEVDDKTQSTAYSTRADVLVPPPPQGGNYAFSLPLSQIYSLLVRPPRIGWWSGSLVVNARGGETYPALFFHDAECKVTIYIRLN
jgi:TBC1 domain family member 15